MVTTMCHWNRAYAALNEWLFPSIGYGLWLWQIWRIFASEPAQSPAKLGSALFLLKESKRGGEGSAYPKCRFSRYQKNQNSKFSKNIIEYIKWTNEWMVGYWYSLPYWCHFQTKAKHHQHCVWNQPTNSFG